MGGLGLLHPSRSMCFPKFSVYYMLSLLLFSVSKVAQPYFSGITDD